MRLLRWLAMAVPVGAFAHTPPSVSIEDALSRADTVFIGRVTHLKELERHPPYLLRAEATVSVVRCLSGSTCSTKSLRIRHFPAVTEGALPVALEFGEQYLFVLQAPPTAKNGAIEFRYSGPSSRMDLAWKIGEGLLTDFSERSEPESFLSVWGTAAGAAREVGFAQLLSWVEARKRRK